jgi:aspartate ammonia-lyase
MGRTELQDAVPMTVGQEFHAFAASLETRIAGLREAEKHLYAVNMGATAIGTGLNAPKGYAAATANHLAKLTGKPMCPLPTCLRRRGIRRASLHYSSALKSTAIKALEDCQRFDSSYFRPESRSWRDDLPALQPGSSIMPGKVNPVIRKCSTSSRFECG